MNRVRKMLLYSGWLFGVLGLAFYGRVWTTEAPWPMFAILCFVVCFFYGAFYLAGLSSPPNRVTMWCILACYVVSVMIFGASAIARLLGV